MISKIKFLETIQKRKLSWKETYRFMVTHLAFYLLCQHNNVFENLSIYVHVHLKGNTMKLSYSNPQNY